MVKDVIRHTVSVLQGCTASVVVFMGQTTIHLDASLLKGVGALCLKSVFKYASGGLSTLGQSVLSRKHKDQNL
jgi:hypothetical protein